MTKIIGIGNALVDVLIHLEDETLLQTLKLPKGGMTLIDEVQLTAINNATAHLLRHRATGGSASNTIHALASLGDNVGFIGSVGDDETGLFFRRQAEARGIETHISTVSGMTSGTATTLITPDGERTFATHLGAATQVVPAEEFPAIIRKQSSSQDILHIEGYLVQDHQLIEQLLREAKAAGMMISYDLASWNIVAADRPFIQHLVADYVDFVFANEEEAAAFSGQQDPEEALRILKEQASVAVVKVGKRGAIGCHNGVKAFAPGLVRKVVDTTAAGDFFAAGFLHGWIHGLPLDRCLDYGNRIAAEVVQVVGTQVAADRLLAALEYS